MHFEKIITEGNVIRALGDYPLRSNSAFYSFSFCNGILTWLSKSVKGTPKNLIVLFEQFTALYGALKDAHAATRIESFGELDSIIFTWEKGPETMTLGYSIVAGSEGMALTYETSKGCSK
jgi:hypothetical protein